MTPGYAFAFAAWARLDPLWHWNEVPGQQLLDQVHWRKWSCEGCREEWRRMQKRCSLPEPPKP